MNKILCFAILFSCLYGFSQTQRYRFYLSDKLPDNDTIVLSNSEILFAKSDSCDNTTLYYKRSKEINCLSFPLCSVDKTPYTGYIHLFRNSINEFIVIWETQYEQIPISIVCYFTNNEIIKIGFLNTFVNVKDSDFFEFPVRDIDITGSKNYIVFNFSNNVYCSLDDAGYLFQSKRIKYIYDKKMKIFKKIIYRRAN